MREKKADLPPQPGLGDRRRAFARALKKDRVLILMVLPVVIHFLIFKYYPMYGNIIAFKNYSPVLGINGSHWAGLKYFEQFFNSPYFFRVIRNTVLISLYSLLWGFPIPVIFALLTNELRNGAYRRVVQSLSYIPYFISTVVVAGMLFNFLSPSTGIVNTVIRAFGGEPVHFLMEPDWFRSVFIASGIWQGFGWSSIVYIAALAGVSPELYEAATMDGAGRLQKIWHVSIPSILPTIVITLILNIGSFMSVGGFDPSTEIKKLRSQLPVRSQECWNDGIIEGVLVDIDEESGKSVGIDSSLLSHFQSFEGSELS